MKRWLHYMKTIRTDGKDYLEGMIGEEAVAEIA